MNYDDSLFEIERRRGTRNFATIYTVEVEYDFGQNTLIAIAKNLLPCLNVCRSVYKRFCKARSITTERELTWIHNDAGPTYDDEFFPDTLQDLDLSYKPIYVWKSVIHSPGLIVLYIIRWEQM